MANGTAHILKYIATFNYSKLTIITHVSKQLDGRFWFKIEVKYNKNLDTLFLALGGTKEFCTPFLDDESLARRN
nr:hypothetical protein Itr_chr02CG23860 [Ipomoea trifida]GMC61682.1 hypothetical protein Iba_chr02bCG22340 [Ipomoea batatas]GMC65592.1 hypothetical protein Iba_chr02dCG15570 [Ipomoea batatas]